MKPLIAITMGDPAGIGPEVIVKAFRASEVHRRCRPIVLGDPEVFRNTIRSRRLPIRVLEVARIDEIPRTAASAKVMPVFHCTRIDPGRIRPGIPTAETGRAALETIQAAVRLAMAGSVSAITTAPVSKEALRAAGSPHPGHTELLAELARSPEVGMLMLTRLPGAFRKKASWLRILLVTTHAALSQVPGLLSTPRILSAIRLADTAARKHFGLSRPRIAVAALNPHAGEGGLLGSEEEKIIRPAVEEARRRGLPVEGPFPADTLIFQAVEGRYDILVAMYHDQALIPIKMLGFGRAVNMTVGLPFVRTSPDHGTAYDIAGRGLADPGSMIEALKWAAELSREKGR